MMVPYGAFTLTETDTDTNKIGLKPIDIGHCMNTSTQSHTTHFFIGLGLGLCQCELTLNGFRDMCTLAPAYNDFGYNGWD